MPRSGRIAALAALALTLVAGRDDPLAGRIAGTPVRCIGIGLVQGPTILDATTILYRQSGKRVWRTGPVGPCPQLRPLSTIIVDIYGGQLCRNDRFRLIEPGLSIPSPPAASPTSPPTTNPDARPPQMICCIMATTSHSIFRSCEHLL